MTTVSKLSVQSLVAPPRRSSFNPHQRHSSPIASDMPSYEYEAIARKATPIPSLAADFTPGSLYGRESQISVASSTVSYRDSSRTMGSLERKSKLFETLDSLLAELETDI